MTDEIVEQKVQSKSRSKSQNQSQVQSPGPGAILKQARESKGLTVADIASKLYLKVVNIEAIEADNYDPTISVTFTKGYLKLYAKQVKVPEQVVIDAFALKYEKEKEPAKLQSFSKRVAKQTKDDRLMLLTYAIVAVLLALVVIWWFQQDSSETTTALEQSPSPSVNEVNNDVAATELLPTRDDLIVSGQMQLESSMVATPRDQQVAAQQQLNADAADIASSEPEQQIIELVFEFAGNCWISLTDATGEAIAFGEKKAGRVMSISGVSPFEVTLGAPEVVKISYDGVTVDMSRFSTGSSVKFTLPFSS